MMAKYKVFMENSKDGDHETREFDTRRAALDHIRSLLAVFDWANGDVKGSAHDNRWTCELPNRSTTITVELRLED